MPDVQDAAPSAAAEPAIVERPSVSLESLTPAQRSQWQLTGELPTTPPADSSPAVPAAQAASTDALAAPASEPGPSAKGKKTVAEKKNAEARIQELLTERAQLRAEIEAAKRPAIDVAPPATVGSAFPDYETWTAQQPAGSPSTWEDFLARRTLHIAAHEQQVQREREQVAAAQREYAEHLTAYRAQAESFSAEHADYWDVVQPLTTMAQTPTNNALGDAIVRAGNPPALFYYLGTHRDVFERLTTLPPHRAVYELGKLDAALAHPATPVAPVSQTALPPPPPPSLTARAAAPVDDVSAALAEGDFRRYRAAQNARDLAAHR
jgi:hypothetical protein